MSEPDWAWVAGLYEGEGTCYFHSGQRTTGGWIAQIRIQLAMCDEDVVNRLPEMTGMGKVYHKNLKGPRKNQWAWVVTNHVDVYMFAKTVWPWLGVRRRLQFIDNLQKFNTHFTDVVPKADKVLDLSIFTGAQ